MKFWPALFSAVFFGVFFSVSGCTAQDSKAPVAVAQSEPSEPSVVEMFTLKSLSGADVSLEALLKENKAVLINFWATWCPPCREEIPDLIKLQEKYKDNAFVILGVDVGESHIKVSNFSMKEGINYPIVLDRDMAVTEAYKVVGIPTTILVNPEGKVLGVYHAFTDELVADVEKALQ